MTSTFSTFQRSWLARAQIAKDEGIPDRAVKATLLNDYNRVLAGSTPMSNQDAYAGMSSAGANQVQTGDPSGNGNLLTNVFHDAQGIFTGIFHAPEQALHLGESLVGGVTAAAEGRGLSQLSNSLSQISQLIPGVTDVEQLAKGNYNYIWEHPLYAALDVAGVGGIASKVADLSTGASKLAIAASEADKAAAAEQGFTTDSPHVTPVVNLSKDEVPVTLSNILKSRHPVMQLSGRLVKSSPLDPILNKTLGPYGLYGNRIQEMIKPYNVLQSMGQQDFQKIASQLADAAETMNPDDTRLFYQLLTKPAEGQTPESIIADKTIPNNVKQAYSGWQHLVDTYNAHAIQAGHNVVVTNPNTGEEVVVGAQSRAAKLVQNHSTRQNRYMVSLSKVNKAQQDYLDSVAPLSKPFFKPVDGTIVPPGQLLTAHDFVSTTRQTMQHADPTSLIDITANLSKDSVRSAIKRYKDLFSDTGPMAQLESALSTNDRAAIRSAMTKVKARTNSKFFNHVPQMKSIRDFITTYQHADRLPKRGVIARVQSLSKRAGKDAEKLTQASTTIDKQWSRVTADNYEQVIAQIMSNKISERAKMLPMGEDDLTNVLDLLNSGELYPTKLQPFLSPREWNLIRRDAIAQYNRLTESGAKVFWVPKVTETDNPGFVRIGADRLPSVSSAKTRALNFSYSIQSPYLGLAKAWQEMIARDRSDQFFEMSVKPRLIPANKIQAQAEDEWQALRQTSSKAPKSFKEYYHHMYGNFMNFNPTDFLHEDSRHIRVSDDIPQMIDKADYGLLQHMHKSVNSPATRTWDASLNLFRHAVLTVSPRFFAHITLGGAFMSLLKTGPSWLKFFPEAHQIIADGNYPASMSRGLGFGTDAMDRIYNPQTFHQFLGGRTSGRLLIESVMHRTGLDKVQAAAQAYHEFLETWSDHYRVMSYLYGKNRAEAKGIELDQSQLADAKRWGLEPAEYAGVQLANKVLADMNGKTPIERTLTRFAFPFGGWSKHVLRYVLQMPLDHPLRTNFLSNLSEQSYEADTSGLPQYLFHLLFLGQPDSMGNVTTIDFRQWNPLRDVANYMTLGGIVSQLNPLAGGLLSAMGINDVTGAPELYPQLQYSSFYGGYQVQAPTGNTALSMLGSYIPEFGVLDHFLKISNYTRALAKTDPSAYNAQLWQSLNIPWAPQTVNIDQIISKQETDRLNTMKQMVTSALQNNDPSYLNNIQGPFPYEGWYFTSSQIKQIITAANQWAAQTGEPVPASELLQTPTAPSIPLAMTPPVSLTSEQQA